MTILKQGFHDAIILWRDTTSKYEIVVAYGYDEKTQTWRQGHYFTLWFGDITEDNKKELLDKAFKFWEENGYY